MQDSLGGNSKTTIIATVSPSSWFVLLAALISDHFIKTLSTNHDPSSVIQLYLCCSTLHVTMFLPGSNALETLSTLKFAQRAKLIRNTVHLIRFLWILLVPSSWMALTLTKLIMKIFVKAWLSVSWWTGCCEWGCFWGCESLAGSDSANEGQYHLLTLLMSLQDSVCLDISPGMWLVMPLKL